MENKHVAWSSIAARDYHDATRWYTEEGGEEVATRFTAAVEQVLEDVAAFPSLSSRRYAEALGFESLRFREIPRFPYLIFYIEFEKHVVIWRVLHRERDLPQQLA